MALLLILASFRLTSYAEWGARSGDPQIFDDVHLEIGKKARNPNGKTLGCLGLGSIQREVARKAKALGMHICYYDVALPPSDVEEALEAERMDSVNALAACADCVSVSGQHLLLFSGQATCYALTQELRVSQCRIWSPPITSSTKSFWVR